MIRTDVAIGSKSIPGHRHRVEGRENEDAGFVSREHPLFDAVMIVADGMGGHPEPKQAAQTAIAAARQYLFARENLAGWVLGSRDLTGLLQRAVQHANAHVRRLAAQPNRTAGSVAAAPVSSAWSDDKPPGCTLIVAVVCDGRLAVANVGDGSIFRFRQGRLTPLAGGEERRLGSRPEQYLGRAEPIDVETAEDRVERGDRILLCTDGLTRYFGAGPSSSEPAGLERLQQVVARVSADPQSLASQLTADGRGELYDDDTTVVVADVGASREVPDPPVEERRQEEREPMVVQPQRPISRQSAAPLPMPIAVIAALAAGVAIGLWHPWERSPGGRQPVVHPDVPPPVDVSSLPRGGVLLIQRGNGRVYVLRTRPVGTPAADEPITLSELRLQPGNAVKDTGNSYQLDVARGRLVDPNGRAYLVSVDGATGVIQIERVGSIRLQTKPAGLPVSIDGHPAGRTPGPLPVRAGRHQVQVNNPSDGSVVWDFWVDVPAGLTVTYGQDVTARKGGRGAGP